MPIGFRQAGNLFIAGPNIGIYPSGSSGFYAISGSASGSGNAITGVTSAGTGNRLIFSSTTGTTLVQKSLLAGTNISINDDGAGTLTFSSPSAITGTYVSGVTSAGTGNRLVFSATVVNNNLVQKSLSAGTGVVITDDGAGTLTFNSTAQSINTYVSAVTSAGTGNILALSGTIVNNNLVQKSLSGGTGIAIIEAANGTLTFSSTSTASGTIISGTNVGAGTAVFSGVVGTNMVFRTLRSGLNASVFLSGTNIVISATTGTINGITALTNVGGGVALASAVTNNTLIARTLSGSNGIDVVESGNLVVVRPSSSLLANRFIIAGTGGALTTSDFYQTDSTVGTMTLGFNTPTSNVTSRLLIEAGSASISQIRLTPFAAAYTGATAGDITYNSTSGNSLLFNKTTTLQTPFIFKDNNFSLSSTTPITVTNTSAFRVLEADTGGTLFAARFLNTLGVFTTITSKTISNTTVETSVLSTGGTFLYGDNLLNRSSHGTNPHLVVGKKYRFNARGVISGTSGGTFYGKMLIGSSLIASSSTFNLNTSLNNNYFEIDTTFTILDVGTNGRVIGSGKMLTDISSLISGQTRPIVAVSALGGLTGVTLNTTSDQFFDFTVRFSTASTTNAVTITEATLEYLN